MDNSDIRSQISAMESKINQLERENAAMRQDISAICTSANNAANALNRTCNNATSSLQQSSNVIEYSDQVLHQITLEQENIGAIYRGFKNIETANKKIRELNNQIYFEFSNFRMVRKIVRGFVDNMNLDMVKPEIIFKSVEKEHLQAPDFWLSAAMLAIMHWRADERDAADRAIKVAMELDDRQTTLFFMSFNLLVGRKDAALKWFDYYRKLEKTGNDAAVILLLLHAVNLRDIATKSTEEIDPISASIAEYLKLEYENSKPMNDIDEVINEFKEHLAQRNRQSASNFGTLRNYVKDYPVMANALNMAKGNVDILDFVEGTNNATRDRGYIFIEKFIDELLETPDKKERAYTDEIAYNEMIIKCVGDLGAAEEAFKARHEHDVSALNLMYECKEWLFSGAANEISDLARSNIFYLTRDLTQTAAKRYASEYRAKMKTTHPVAIKDYTTELNFQDKARELKKVEGFYQSKKESQLAAVKNTAFVLCIVFAALCLVGGIVSGIMVGMPLMIALFVGAVALAIGAVVNFFSAKKKRAEIIEKNERDTVEVKKIIEALFEEYAKYMQVYEEHDRIADDIDFAIKR